MAQGMVSSMASKYMCIQVSKCRAIHTNFEIKSTTLCSRKYKNLSRVIDPSTTVLATMPSKVSNPSPETLLPRTNAPLMTARDPFFERPQRR